MCNWQANDREKDPIGCEVFVFLEMPKRRMHFTISATVAGLGRQRVLKGGFRWNQLIQNTLSIIKKIKEKKRLVNLFLNLSNKSILVKNV